MNGLSNISDKIIADANAAADEILMQAKEDAAKILDDGKEGCANALLAEDKAREAKCEDTLEKLRLAAQLEGKKLISNTRRTLVNSVRDKALEQLLSLPDKEYLKLLVSLVSEVASDNEGGEIAMNEKDLKRCGKALIKELGGNLTLCEKPVGIIGGLILRRGSVEYNCTLNAVLNDVFEKAAPEVSNILFAEGA